MTTHRGQCEPLNSIGIMSVNQNNLEGKESPVLRSHMNPYVLVCTYHQSPNRSSEFRRGSCEKSGIRKMGIIDILQRLNMNLYPPCQMAVNKAEGSLPSIYASLLGTEHPL